jgi:hypothetical protein
VNSGLASPISIRITTSAPGGAAAIPPMATTVPAMMLGSVVSGPG